MSLGTVSGLVERRLFRREKGNHSFLGLWVDEEISTPIWTRREIQSGCTFKWWRIRMSNSTNSTGVVVTTKESFEVGEERSSIVSPVLPDISLSLTKSSSFLKHSPLTNPRIPGTPIGSIPNSQLRQGLLQLINLLLEWDTSYDDISSFWCESPSLKGTSFLGSLYFWGKQHFNPL